MAPRNSICKALCCCIFEPIPGHPGLPVPSKFVLLFRCISWQIVLWIGGFTLISWLIFFPHDIQEPGFTVTNAFLSQFNFNNSDNNTDTNLHYDLALNITIRNPNRRLGFYYHSMVVSTSYRKRMFGVNLTDSVPFYQGYKNTTLLHNLVLQGQQQLVKFGERDISQFDKETAAGVYSIDLHLTFRVRVGYGKVRYGKFGKFVIETFKPTTNEDQCITCKMKLPFSVTNETSGSGFKATKCNDVGIFS